MENRKKILFVITQFYRGGAETALLHLFEQLPPSLFEVDFLILNQLHLAKATSLLNEIPSYIHVFNPTAKQPHWLCTIYNLFMRVCQRLFGASFTGRGIRMVKNKHYDWALSYGEWVNPAIVGKKITATHKAVWIHTDIDKSLFFDENKFFECQNQYDRYLFASANSMAGAVNRWPFLKEKAVVVHNVINAELVKQGALQSLSAGLKEKLKKPLLLSVGNLRPEKNYPRQIEAMAILQQQGVKFTWLIVGSDVDTTLTEQLRHLIKQHQLEDCFLLLGADPNPYKYMRWADAVCALGDYESWSLVISEAFILGIPVIATKTSGAMQQITDNVNGLLTNFDAESIAKAIHNFLEDATLQQTLRLNACTAINANIGVEEFISLVNTPS